MIQNENIMATEDKVTPISKSHTIEEMVEFWDARSIQV